MTKSVVVIGAGHNGLICATYLAKAGYKVEVLEACNNAGGSASLRSFGDGYKAPLAHVPYGLHSNVCSDLGLKGSGAQHLDTISLDLEGQHLTLGRDQVSGSGLSNEDIQAYAAFKKEFRDYAKALEPMMINKPPRLKDMDWADKITLGKLGWQLRFGLGADSMLEFLRVGGINIYDVLNEQFSDERLKGALSLDAVLGQHMGPRTPTTVLTYLHRIWAETFDSGSGAQEVSVAASLTEVAEKAGVAIRTGAPVTRIQVENSQVCGVELENGETVQADLVVSNADAKATFLSLLDTAELDAMLVHRIQKTRVKGNVAKLHLALNALPQVSGLSADQLSQRLIVAPSMKYVEHAFNAAKYGEYSAAPILEIALPTLRDASLAPSGHHVMSVAVSFAPYSLRAGWGTARDKFADDVLKLLETYMPGLSGSIVGQDLLTPEDIEQNYHVTGGHWHHGELAIDQSFMMRPVHGTAQYDAPIDGLYLCGAASHPGGGVTGVPGHNAAKRILAMQGRG